MPAVYCGQYPPNACGSLSSGFEAVTGMHDRFICLNLTHCPHAIASKVMLLLLDIVAPHGLLWVAFLALFPAACGLTMDTVAVCPCNHWLVTSTLPGLILSITACVSLSLGLESARHHCCPWFISSSAPHCQLYLQLICAEDKYYS